MRGSQSAALPTDIVSIDDPLGRVAYLGPFFQE
jgi:hypothetical protein